MITFFIIAVLLYMILSKLVRTNDDTRTGEELLAYAATVALIIAVIKVSLFTLFIYIGGDDKHYNRLLMTFLTIGAITLPILIGVALHRLSRSSDWQFNKASRSEIIIALLISFIPLIIFSINLFFHKKNEY